MKVGIIDYIIEIFGGGLSFLSDLSEALRNDFHSLFSISKTVLNEGIVLPPYGEITILPLLFQSPHHHCNLLNQQ
jgi:hypothetical protein